MKEFKLSITHSFFHLKNMSSFHAKWDQERKGDKVSKDQRNKPEIAKGGGERHKQTTEQ